ncbi:MAG: acyl carrier protein [Thainema sp.]
MNQPFDAIAAYSAHQNHIQPSAEAIELWMIERLANLFQTDINNIDPEVPFDDYGLDSAAAVGLTGELEEWLQRSVSPTLLYDYPTIAGLADYLAHS